jgi:SAM-dependent methyltransferase
LTKQDMRSIVRVGYETGDYAAYYRKEASIDPWAEPFMQSFAAALPAGGRVLDWGAGTGVPYDRWLVQLGFSVTGVDIAEKHVALARLNVPAGKFILGDFSRLDFGQDAYHGLLSLYAIFHLPRSEHAGLLQQAYRLLKPEGMLLVTVGVRSSGEMDTEDGWCGGAQMAWSHYDAETNLCMLRECGFTLLHVADESQAGSAEQHLWVLARKPQ